ncbi:crotonase/enoyl-CoA hydratase family protein [Rhodococcus sp. Rp3]|uniref:crotonase/enoyl-CoA hydratase family protein n=1 Tax=Rhodococcus sp. Rp3 TaxID=2807635 RepID=UPI00233EC990|nr:crotonase/enoyl-CoA hydratase family protein [Rhodococcus sp. Rp3]MDC3724395.1 crotonase/enoyl-CoA hydratase family protein [Rhodococcus sp. Rp3]
MPEDALSYELDDDIALIGINRPDKRNAMPEALFAELGQLAEKAGREARAAVLFGHGPHFSAGLDLADLAQRLQENGGKRPPHVGPYMPHVAFDMIARGRIPFVAALSGAVIGAGLEVAASTHIRVADDTAFFALPEAQRGIFVGAGGSVRIQRLIGNARMTDMMLTGRVLDADAACAQNLVQYRVSAGEALQKARELAHAIARNRIETNWSVTQGLSRVNDMSYDDALFVETLVGRNAAAAGSDRLVDFLEKRAKPLARPATRQN